MLEHIIHQLEGLRKYFQDEIATLRKDFQTRHQNMEDKLHNHILDEERVHGDQARDIGHIREVLAGHKPFFKIVVWVVTAVAGPALTLAVAWFFGWIGG